MLKNLIIRTRNTDPYFNQTLGTYITRSWDKTKSNNKLFNKVLFVCTNRESLSLGRNQHYFNEFNTEVLSRKPIEVTRRDTGGGATYVDEGTVLFSLHKRLAQENDSLGEGYPLLVNTLHNLGFIGAEKNGRNDILINKLKVSGSAFAIHGNAFKHHGSLLVNTNKDRMTEYLTPNVMKLQSKAIQSVHSRVVNLQELNSQITVPKVQNALIETFCKTDPLNQSMEIMCSDTNDLQKELPEFNLPLFQEILDQFLDARYIYSGNYGQYGEHKQPLPVSRLEEKIFSFGFTQFYYYRSHDKVRKEECDIFSDALDLCWISILRQVCLKVGGERFRFLNELKHVCTKEHPEYQQHYQEVFDWLMP